MNTGSQDARIAKVLAGFSGEQNSPPSREGFGGVDFAVNGEDLECDLSRRDCDRLPGRRGCDCDDAGATVEEERRPVADTCGNDLFGEFDFDPHTLSALVDIDSEVCLTDWVLENPGQARRERGHRPELMIVGDLDLVTTAPSETWQGSVQGLPPGPLPPNPNPLDIKNPAPPPFGYDAPSLPPQSLPDVLPAVVLGSEDEVHTGWAFRISKHGACHGVQQIPNRFALAYQVVRSAELELLGYMQESAGDVDLLKAFWYAGGGFASLAWWFGGADQPLFSTRVNVVVNALVNWSARFRHGYYKYKFQRPVYIRCRPNDYVTGANAYHLEPNVVTLLGPWFDLKDSLGYAFPYAEALQTIILLHEMGHYSENGASYGPHWWYNMWNGLTIGPQDRKSDKCNGDKCYREPLDEKTLEYTGGNPFELRRSFNAGDEGAVNDMLLNIDNYVCYMWNRWNDRGYRRYHAL